MIVYYLSYFIINGSIDGIDEVWRFFFAVKTVDFTRFRHGKNNYYIGIDLGYLKIKITTPIYRIIMNYIYMVPYGMVRYGKVW